MADGFGMTILATTPLIPRPDASSAASYADRERVTLYPHVPVILMTAYGAIPDAVTAIKEGAFDYLTKPFDPDDALVMIRRALTTAAVDEQPSAPPAVQLLALSLVDPPRPILAPAA